MIDWYKILELSPGASQEEIAANYRRLAKKYHPDVSSGEEAALKFKEITQAFEILTNKTAQPTHQEFSQRNNFDDIIFDMFGGGVLNGRNIQAKVEISLDEVHTGCTKEVRVKKRNRCKTCQGSGCKSSSMCDECGGIGFKSIKEGPFTYNVRMNCNKCNGSGRTNIISCDDCNGYGFGSSFDELISVDIPPGIDVGMQINIKNKGEESKQPGSRHGDLIVFVSIKDHPIFRREKKDLVVEIPVTYSQLTLGSDLEVPTLKGFVLVKMPPGTQSNTRFRLKGEGVPDMRNRAALGDIVVYVKLETPAKIDEAYKKHVEDLSVFEKANISTRIDAWDKKFAAYKASKG